MTIILIAVIAVLIYRLGLCDGQAVSRGEKLKHTVTVTKKPKAEQDEKIKRGIKNILDYGLEVK